MKLLKKLLSAFILALILSLSVIYVSNSLGFRLRKVPVSGTGSMYPTFPKGTSKTVKQQSEEVVGAPGMFPYPNGLLLFGKTLFGHKISRGDIVVVENTKTDEITKEIIGEETGWVKRVVGLSGEEIEIRDGTFYINGSPLEEPYTAQAHSTFGEKFLSECQKITVPKNSVFVMGDNRKGSGDSREVGFFKYSDISYVLPVKNQKGELKSHYRDTSKDFDESTKIKLDKNQYFKLLNEKRNQAGLKSLKYQPKLEDSAASRGRIILKYDDFSFEATRSGYTQKKAMADSGYSNIIYGEIPNLGYYESSELIEYFFEFPETKKFLLNKDFQEIGISEVEGKLNGCPSQIIVQHLAGYIPPNYSKEVINSWKNALTGLKEVQPSWNNLKNYNEFYQANKNDVDRIIEINNIRISNISSIVDKMDSNQWLTDEQENYIKNIEPKLADEENTLAKKLNSWQP